MDDRYNKPAYIKQCLGGDSLPLLSTLDIDWIQRASGALEPAGRLQLLFAWIGFLKRGAEPDQEVQKETSDFLKQPFIPIRAAGALRDSEGKRTGMMMIFETEDQAAAEAFVSNSPFLRADLYRDYHLVQFQNEVG